MDFVPVCLSTRQTNARLVDISKLVSARGSPCTSYQLYVQSQVGPLNNSWHGPLSLSASANWAIHPQISGPDSPLPDEDKAAEEEAKNKWLKSSSGNKRVITLATNKGREERHLFSGGEGLIKHII